MRVTFKMLVDRHPRGRCSPPGEDWACGCSYVEVERTVTAEVQGADVRLCVLRDEQGVQISLGSLSKQEQNRARELALDAAGVCSSCNGKGGMRGCECGQPGLRCTCGKPWFPCEDCDGNEHASLTFT